MYPADQPSDSHAGHQSPLDPAPAVSRRRLVGIFSGLAVLGLVIGIGAAELVRAFDQPGLSGALTSASPTASSSESADEELTEPTPSAEVSESDLPVVETSSTTPDLASRPVQIYRPIPTDAASEAGLDFGFLTRVDSAEGTVSLQFDRATLYTGAEATRRNGGRRPLDDYLIENDNEVTRSFTLDPKASVMAAGRLLNRTGVVGREPLTMDEFVHNCAQALDAGAKLPVWLRHTEGMSGPVTALAEQFLP